MGPFVVAKLWILMAEHNVIPPEGEIKHLLWTLHFLEAYPRQAAVYSMVGGFIRSAKQDDNYGASNIVLPCPSS
jgi:hypothetical protein